MRKLDLHTHSIASPDGGIRPEHYRLAIENGLLDCIAITDHNHIKQAAALHNEMGKKIIVGEEITSLDGEIIGLFLTKVVKPHKTARETVDAIKEQGGLVYIPHPFETVRSGLKREALIEIAEFVDIVEAHNGRAFFQNFSELATDWADTMDKVTAASSDAHGVKGLGTTYTLVETYPTADTLLKLLGGGSFATKRPPMRTLLYPKANRFRKRLRLQ